MKYQNVRDGLEFNDYSTGFLYTYGFVRCSIGQFNKNISTGIITRINSGPLEGLYIHQSVFRRQFINGSETIMYFSPDLIRIYNADIDAYRRMGTLWTKKDFLGNQTRYDNAHFLNTIVFKDRREDIYAGFTMSVDDSKKYRKIGDTLYIEESVFDCGDTLFRITEEYDLVYTNTGDLKESCDCAYIDSECKFYSKDDSDICYIDEYDEFLLKDHCVYSPNLEFWIHSESESYIFCSDIHDYVHYEDAYYDERSGDYLSEKPQSSEYIVEYHRSPSSSVIYNSTSGSHKYGIGFEVEKNSILGKSDEGDCIGEYKFFSGFETDSSCGVEGISNIYCLEYGYDTLKEHVKEAAEILNDENVDSNCGGHINVSGPSDVVNLANIRKYSGLLFAMYRYRLQKSYSSHNKKLEEYNKRTKYSAIREKDTTVGFGRKLVEFRLISRVEHSNQILFRYKLIQKLIKAVEKGISFEEYLADNQSLLKAIYSEEKLRRINSMAISFNSWINAEHEFLEESQDNIKQFI